MSAPAPANPSLETRLAQLESLVASQQRKLCMHRAIGLSALLLLVGGAMVAAVAQQVAPKVIRAQRLEIVTEDGKPLLNASAGINGGRLELIDRNGDVLLAAQASGAGGQLDLWNASGRNVLRAACNDNGGDLAIWNSDGKNVAGAYATPTGGETYVFNHAGQLAFRATSGDQGGALMLAGGNGKPLLTAGSAEDASGGTMTVFAADGTRSVTATAESDGCGRLDVFNNADKSVFSVDGQRDLGCVMGLANNIGTPLFLFGTRAGGGVLNVMNDRGEKLVMLGIDDGGWGAMTLKNSSGTEIITAGADENRDGTLIVRDATNSTMRVLKPGR